MTVAPILFALHVLPILATPNFAPAPIRKSLADEERVLVGLERLSGMVSEPEVIDGPGGTNHDAVRFGFLAPGIEPFSIPRLTLCYSSKNFTLDFGLGVSVDTDDAATSLIYGRFGYLIPFTDDLLLWPKAGLSGAVKQLRADENGDQDIGRCWAISTTIDLAFVLLPQVALLVGPFLDLAVTGDLEFYVRRVKDSVDWTPTAYGGQLGVLIYY